MESIVIDHLSHSYDQSRVLADVCLEIRQGELFTLLGPSGCGKTTLLRAIAGFLTPSQGRVLLDGRDITALPPEKRGMGVVFQNYALFPNLTVAENIAYGLRIRRCSAREIREKCAYFLRLTNLSEYRDRQIEQLSGGQQQRVALARALIVSPAMLLLDEPLSNLDAGLRVKMRREIQDIQANTGVTTLFITHDQQEALSISHRLAVMDHGVVQQIGAPRQLYDRPANDFVADFVGVSNRFSREEAQAAGLTPDDGPYLRPERLTLSAQGPGLPVTVEQVQFDGPCYSYVARSAAAVYHVVRLNDGCGETFRPGDRAFLRRSGQGR